MKKLMNSYFRTITLLFLIFAVAGIPVLIPPPPSNSQEPGVTPNFVLPPLIQIPVPVYPKNPQLSQLLKPFQLPLINLFSWHTVPTTEVFDGKVLYQTTFERMRDHHISLVDPKVREAWCQEWEHKFDTSGELNTEEGTDKAILKMLQSLKQRFDYYLNEAQSRKEEHEIDTTMVGIGIKVKLSQFEKIIKSLPQNSKKEDVEKALLITKGNAAVISDIFPGTPAQKAGLKPGDIIRKVDGKDLYGMSLDNAIKLIKGPEATEVELTIQRRGGFFRHPITWVCKVTRAKIISPVVKIEDLGHDMVYVRLSDFMSKNGPLEMQAALLVLKLAQAKGLILDLRSNPGGLMPNGIAIASMLLPEGPVYVAKYREKDAILSDEIVLNPNVLLEIQPVEHKVSFSQRQQLLLSADVSLVVLINGGSASCAEILAGALQYNHRAVIVGKPSFGKGVGQKLFKLPFGRRIHVTNFEFLAGRESVDWVGVIPDFEVENKKDSKNDSQLDKAKQVLRSLIKQQNKLAKQRENLRKQNEEWFQKQLKEREEANTNNTKGSK